MRLLVLILSLGTLVLYGRAIAGLWGYFIGQPRPVMLITGLTGGTISAVAAIILWRRRMRNLDWIKEDSD